jgi:hypothetical protein
MFAKWWRMDEEQRQRMWRLYGWFTALSCCGSCCGAATWLLYAPSLAAAFVSNAAAPDSPTTGADRSASEALQYRLHAGACVLYALEFFCLSIAKLLVLDRMMDFVVAAAAITAHRRWAAGGRCVMAGVVAGNAVGLCGSVTAAVHWQQAAGYSTAASAAFASNGSSAPALQLQALAAHNQHVAEQAQSVQQFAEVVVLLAIILAFAVVGIACAHRVSSALRLLNAEQRTAGAVGRRLRLQIVATVVVVFVTFLLRAVFSTMNALAGALLIEVNTCSNRCDPACNNVWLVIKLWLVFTPEFQLIVVLISSPLALLVALWGMTSEHTLQHMRSGRRLTVSMVSQPLVAAK